MIKSFLRYASHHTVEDLQSFTAQSVPSPSWVRTENITIPEKCVSKAACAITEQLGPNGIEQVGGTQWWQWRPRGGVLKAEWIEMRAHYNEQKRQGSKSRLMLYVHGGAYFFGSVDEHRYQMQRHARKLKARVFAPRYRLAPQFPFPCGLQDCLAAYFYLLSIHDAPEIILAGDSAGGGMLVSIMCLLRDRGLPLPAGAILISPWVDLSHSFPSLGGNADLDYIPPYGFMQKPSTAWPPPNNEELGTISKLARDSGGSAKLDEEIRQSATVPTKGDGGVEPSLQLPLNIELDGKRVTLKDQIQIYTTNQLLAHPLVSPILQPSLGGLPPILIVTGGGEILRDEQIYLAHKMANPSNYPLGAAYRSRYDPGGKLLNKYKPTPVQLQVWEDLCHVAPTLSFTRPAKFMYRSIAQFGAWVLAKAQKRAIEIIDDDNISIISSQTDTDYQADAASSADSMAREKLDPTKVTGSVGRAGDPLPLFENNMIRQRIDRYGRIYPLAEPHDLPALQMHPDEVGVIKPGPVRKWLEAKSRWDTKYASTRRRVQEARIRALVSGEVIGFEAGEHPPPSALASRRTGKDIVTKKKSHGLAMWSLWGSKHDESAMKRDEDAFEAEKSQGHPPAMTVVDTEPQQQQLATDGMPETLASPTSLQHTRSRKRSMDSKRRASESRTRGRRRTISVTDQGQVEGRFLPPIVPPIDSPMSTQSPEATTGGGSPGYDRATSENPSLLSAGFIPKFRTASHFRDDSDGGTHASVFSDAAITTTSPRPLLHENVSTRAVFAAPGVMKGVDVQEESRDRASCPTTTIRPQSLHAHETKSIGSIGEDGSIAASAFSRPYTSIAGLGSDTPRSQRSLDRLQSHQQDEGMGRLAPLRSPSSTAVVRAEGVVDAIDGTTEEIEKAVQPPRAEEHGDELNTAAVLIDAKSDAQQGRLDGIPNSELERPKMYDRGETEFQTALKGSHSNL